jgi:hypothetical protein
MVILLEKGVPPAVTSPPGETVQIYELIPGCVEYTFILELTHTEEGPDNVGTGKAFTVTFRTTGAEAVQLAAEK